VIVRTSPVSEVAAAADCSPAPTIVVAASATRRGLLRLIRPLHFRPADERESVAPSFIGQQAS
jgi:hypothetical protein